MRHLNEIILHCSATPEGRHFTVEDIDRWHRDRGWNGIGYHYVIYLDGSVHKGRPISKQGAHVSKHNKNTVGICYIGGLDKNKRAKDTRTPAQKKAMHKLCKDLVKKYPSIKKISGHNQYANKACPCFSVPPEFSYIVDGTQPPKATPAPKPKPEPVEEKPTLLGFLAKIFAAIFGRRKS